MTIFEPDLLGFLIHQIDKGFDTAGQPLSEHDASIITRLDDGAVQQIVDADPGTERHEHLRTASPPRFLADRQLVAQLCLAVLQHREDGVNCHHLGHGGRRNALVRTLVEQHRAGLDFDDHRMGCFGIDAPSCLRGRARCRRDRRDGLDPRFCFCMGSNRRTRLTGQADGGEKRHQKNCKSPSRHLIIPDARSCRCAGH
jgi:hypothetical protein